MLEVALCVAVYLNGLIYGVFPLQAVPDEPKGFHIVLSEEHTVGPGDDVFVKVVRCPPPSGER
jgi:hypothetical protein